MKNTAIAVAFLALCPAFAHATLVPENYTRYGVYALTPSSTVRVTDLVDFPLAGLAYHNDPFQAICLDGSYQAVTSGLARCTPSWFELKVDCFAARRASGSAQIYYRFTVDQPTTVIVSSNAYIVPVVWWDQTMVFLSHSGGTMVNFTSTTGTQTANLVPGVNYRFYVYNNRNNLYQGGEVTNTFTVKGTMAVANTRTVPLSLSDYSGSTQDLRAQVQVLRDGLLLESLTNLPVLPDGTIAFTPSVTGLVDFKVKVSHWLARSVPGVMLNNDYAALPDITLANGDINDDNEVGPADFSMLALAFGSFLGDPNFNVAADLNGDEEVGPADFVILSKTFGEMGD